MSQDMFLDCDQKDDPTHKEFKKDYEVMGIEKQIVDDAFIDEAMEKMGFEPKEKHPLINDNSPHYEMIGGVQSIELMEKMFTREELMAWAKISAMKYRMRIGAKDHPKNEITKIKSFEAYYRYLEEQR
jgi:hypothetical protein